MENQHKNKMSDVIAKCI